METGVSSPKSRLEFLDGVRGMAAFMVVSFHFTLCFLGAGNPTSETVLRAIGSTWLRALVNGPFCVDTFFVLSGFVIAHSASKGGNTLISQIVARYVRLTVPMTASLLFAWFLYRIFPWARIDLQALNHDAWVRNVHGHPLPSVWIALRDGLYRLYHLGRSRFNNPVWTMKYELIGSMAIYFVACFESSGRRIALLLLGLVGVQWDRDYLGFILGALLREWWVKGGMRDNRFSWVVLLVAAGIAAYAFTGIGGSSPPGQILAAMEKPRAIPYSCAAGLLIYAICTLPALRALFSSKVPRWLGKISFCLYLVHVPLLYSVAAWLYVHLTLSLPARLLLVYLVEVGLALLFGWLMTLLVDDFVTHRLKALKIAIDRIAIAWTPGWLATVGIKLGMAPRSCGAAAAIPGD